MDAHIQAEQMRHFALLQKEHERLLWQAERRVSRLLPIVPSSAKSLEYRIELKEIITMQVMLYITI